MTGYFNYGYSTANWFWIKFSMHQYTKPLWKSFLILSQKQDTAPGFDNINHSVIKTYHIWWDLLQIFNNLSKGEYMSNGCKKPIIVPLLKYGKNPNRHTSYRPLILTSNQALKLTYSKIHHKMDPGKVGVYKKT